MAEYAKEYAEKLNTLGYEMHKDTKGVVHADVMTKEYVNPQRKGVVSLDPKASGVIGRELTDIEKQGGTCYVMTEQGVVTDPDAMPTDLQMYILFRNQVAAEKGIGKSSAQEKSQALVPEIVEQRKPVIRQAQTPVISGQQFMQKIGDAPTELVMTLGDKRYATKYGRWYALHMSGRSVRSSKVDVIQTPYEKENVRYKPGNAVVKCTIVLNNGTKEGETYEALGEAGPDNVSSMIFGDKDVYDKKGTKIGTKHTDNLLHMAETKAKNRAIGDATAGGWYIGQATQQYDVKHVEGCSAEEVHEFEGVPGDMEP